VQRNADGELNNAPLQEFQGELLQAAFDIATAIPAAPHIKDRSRAQEKVADACLTLDQPQRARSCIERIGNWRRGLGYADYAFYSVQQGVTQGAASLLDEAEKISSTATQEWRRDRIENRVRQVRSLLENETAPGAARQADGGSPDPSEAEEKLKQIDSMVATGDFDLINNALQLCAQMYERSYADPEIRSRTEEKIKSSWEKTPYFMRIDTLLKLAAVSLDQGDAEPAARLVHEAGAMVDGADWPVKYAVMMSADVAGMRFRCGDRETALAELGEALSLFREQGESIVNIDQADALIPVAEGYAGAGDMDQALAVYALAVEAAVLNPNSRPRAEDLSALCVSMALQGAVPDEKLWGRIQELQANLGDPW
jgi:tetratricopeptide (TPR) repeat protein